MPTVLPSSSMILLVPTGPEWSNVNQANRDMMVGQVDAKVDDKRLICHWLFNAKKVEVATVVTGPSPSSFTRTYEAGIDHLDITAQGFPFPHNYLIDGPDSSWITCPPIEMDSNSSRWLEVDGNPGSYSFYVFVFNGEWYWTPGLWADTQEVTELGIELFKIIWDNPGGQHVEITYKILETFFPYIP